ncbi:MAG: SpoIVB peptidase [Oscillospiraceae bacterium]|nr:SpoIVB peptidase [Oscillospiraceae bacterium]
MLKKTVRICTLLSLLTVLFGFYIQTLIPENMYFTDGGKLEIKSLPMVTISPKQTPFSRSVSSNSGQLKYTARLFGVVPIKEVNISKSSSRVVSVAGTPFGIKMFSDGVMIVGFSDIPTTTGYHCPARLSGLKMGDVIVSFNDTQPKSNDDVEKFIVNNTDRPINVTFMRDGITQSCTLVPVMDSDTGVYRTGMWVRDSSAGVGTMTFYDTQQKLFAGLGHGIRDTDTQKDIKLLSGEIVPVSIMGLTKSKNGEAGELKGTFLTDIPMGKVLANSTNGVYGTIFMPPHTNMMPVATPQEITAGKAQILTTISGNRAKYYDIEIEKVALTSSNQNKNLVIRITDPELLALTGGIVQGMSGSPIIQNGKLVGAVTHVFVNQVERGYGVFAQNMLFSMDNAAKVNSAKTASADDASARTSASDGSTAGNAA